MIRSASLILLALAACSQGQAQEASPTAETSAKPAVPKVTAPKGPLALGTEMPSAEVEMQNIDGAMVTIAGTKGEKGTLVVFTCNHCPYAKAWEKRITDIGNAWKKKGFGVVAINPNDPSAYAEDAYEEMIKRAHALGMEFPYVVDATSDVARAYGATKTPEVYLFDADAKLVYQGAVDDNAKDAAGVEAHYLNEALTALSKGEKIEMPMTKAVGCSIKFRAEA